MHLLGHSHGSQGTPGLVFVLASTSWFIFASSSQVGMCSWDRDWLDLVLGCMVVGPLGSTATIGIFGIGVLGFVLE